ncbi:unnamed protein product [Paramecium sonneborni]|uniref:Cyclic nucleotide-binding domain-containing protein n=1 Tax=Paramecium sonneborni TaxID=65129 RepID=A0A8S1R1L3_9CILI|nr:unnamed protein product [Paramecium sonneborni]
MNIQTLLLKQERTKREVQQLIECLGQVKFLNELNNGQKLYQATLRGFAEKATLIRYEKGHIIWREGIKQEKLFIILSGRVQEYVQLDDEEVNRKRNDLIEKYPECQDLFINKPGRRIVYEYENETSDQIKASINDNMRKRRSLVFEIPSMLDVPLIRSSSVIQKNIQPFSKITVNEAPLSYMIVLSKEVRECLREVKLMNDYHLQYFIQEFVLAVRQGRMFSHGDLLNSDIQKKKFDNTLLCMEDSMIMQIGLEDYHNIEIHLNQRKQQKIWDIIYSGLFGKSKVSQEEANQIMKVLVNKYTSKKYTQYNVVYLEGETQKFIYIVKEGEFQLSFDNHGQETVLQSTMAIAKVSQGSMLGEESYTISRHIFNCISISSKNKIIGLSIHDLEALGHRFVWLRDLLKNKEKIKQQWLKTRMNENVHFSNKLNEKQQNFDEEKKLINEFKISDPEIQITQFQRLQPKHRQMITPSPLKRPKLIKVNSQRNVNTSRNNSQGVNKKLENLNIFGNEILCELGIGKITTQNTKISNIEPIDHSLTYRDTSRLLLKKVRKTSNYNSSQPFSHRDNSTINNDNDIVPMMMNMSKNQLQFLKTMVGKFNHKNSQPSPECFHQQSTPVLIQSIYPKRIVRRAQQGYD